MPWEFDRYGETLLVTPRGPVVSNVIEIEVGAATSGLGVIRTFEELLTPAIKTGALVPILEDWVTEFSGPFLYYASRRHMPSTLRAFVDFVKAEQRKAG